MGQARILHVTCAIVLAWITFATTTMAQGTQDRLPDPIAASRMAAYADLLDLSPQQRHALDDLHAAYRAEFQNLRESDIAAWMKTGAGGYTREYIRAQHRLIERIAAMDDRFLDSSAAILTEEQAGRLPRAKALRQRERAMQVQGAWSWQDAPPFDLSQAVAGAALATDERLAIDSTLQSYEATLTTKFQRTLDAYFTTFDKSFDAYDAAGWTDEKRADDANFEAVYATVKPLWTAWEIQQHEQMKRVVELNRRTLATLRPLLPAASWRTLWKSFISRSYSNVHFLREMPALVQMHSPAEKALMREDLTVEQRAALQAQVDEFERELNEVIDALIAKIEAYRDAWIGAADRNEEFDARNALDREVSEASDAIRQHRAEQVERLAAMLGPEPAAAPLEAADPETADLAKVSFYALTFGRPEVSFHLPPAITGVDLSSYARWLALDDAAFARLREAHDRYLHQFAEFKDRHRTMLMNASAALHAGDTIQGWTAENLRNVREANAAAKSAQQSIEASFFVEIESIAGRPADDAALARVHLARERQWLNSGVYSSQTRQAGGRCDGLYDLERLLRRVRAIDLSEPAVDRILCEYEQAIAPPLKARQDAMLAYLQLDDDLRVEWQELRAKVGERNADMRERNDEAGIKRLQLAARDAAGPISELNRATVERLEQALPAESARRVRWVYERMTWPHIYGDRFSSAPLLAAAMGLHDLSPAQRSGIEDIAAAYHPAYQAICERMKTMVEGPDSSIYDQEHSTEQQRLGYMQRAAERDRVVFERYELNMKVWQQLKGVLTEGQAKAIGMGAAPPDPPTPYDQFGT